MQDAPVSALSVWKHKGARGSLELQVRRDLSLQCHVHSILF